MPSGRKPDYNLWVANKESDQKGKAGAAWKNEDGSISIQLDPYVVIRGRGHSGGMLTIMLFPYTPYEPKAKGKGKDNVTDIKGKKEPEQPKVGYGTDLEDDIPF